jgi:hypothetical protein
MTKKPKIIMTQEQLDEIIEHCNAIAEIMGLVKKI